MNTHCTRISIVLAGLLVIGAPAWGKNVLGSKLPDPVMNTFKANFPKAKIEKLDMEVENGVEVYDFEFRQGAREKETDIAGDGTLMERTLVIDLKTVPEVPRRAIYRAGRGAKFGRIERIDIEYDTADGKVVKLAKPTTRYAAEMSKGGRHTEIIVASDGSVVEAPKW
jgi:hypothetical protein